MNTTTEAPRRYEWRIATAGPVSTFVGTWDEVKSHVEAHAPMKRGWTGSWHTDPDHPKRRRYIRANSRGRVLPGYGILVTRASYRIR